MVHQATIRVDTLSLRQLEMFSPNTSGLSYSVPNSNIKLNIIGDNKERMIQLFGCKSTEEADEILNRLRERLSQSGISSIVVESPSTINIAARANIDLYSSLEDLFEFLQEQGHNVEYEPEQFPAIILRVEDVECTCTIFNSGTVMIQGIKTTDLFPDIEEILSEVESISRDISN
ncbi:TBP family protein [Natronobacterium texcoconense]|nr:hypothetical protein [Natronobacterium texcoconense]